MFVSGWVCFRSSITTAPRTDRFCWQGGEGGSVRKGEEGDLIASSHLGHFSAGGNLLYIDD